MHTIGRDKNNGTYSDVIFEIHTILLASELIERLTKFQDTALQFMNRISMEDGGVSADERTMASLLLQAPRKTLRLLVADATESAGTE